MCRSVRWGAASRWWARRSAAPKVKPHFGERFRFFGVLGDDGRDLRACPVVVSRTPVDRRPHRTGRRPLALSRVSISFETKRGALCVGFPRDYFAINARERALPACGEIPRMNSISILRPHTLSLFPPSCVFIFGAGALPHGGLVLLRRRGRDHRASPPQGRVFRTSPLQKDTPLRQRKAAILPVEITPSRRRGRHALRFSRPRARSNVQRR